MNFENRTQLFEIAKWTRIVSLLTYFLFGSYLIYCLFVLKRLLRLSDSVNDLGILLGFLNVYYLLAGLLVVLLFIVPVTRLFQFSGSLERAALTDDEMILNRALSKLKSAFKFYGISLLALSLVAAILGCWWLSVEL
jgi:hypothetical protein